MTQPEAGRQALGHIDRARADRPEKNGDALSGALRSLATFRDELIARQRQAPDAAGRRRLDHVNAVISGVMACQFPLGEVPWAELDAARGWLGALLDEGASAP